MDNWADAAHNYTPLSPASGTEGNNPPSYGQLLEWLAHTDSRALALDFWARGNYVKYLAASRQMQDPVVIVPFDYIDELRVYFRRMVLMGLPAHYVYTGELSPQEKVSFTVPGEDDFVFDGGAGFLVIMSEPFRIRGRKWLYALGKSRIMPEVFAEWLLEEAAVEFASGRAFLSPAELIGIPKPLLAEGLDVAAEVQDSIVISSKLSAAEFIFNLELPYIDDMPHDTFTKIIGDHDDRLFRFRRAIRKLVAGVVPGELDDTLEELKDEIAQLRLSDSGLRFRQTISRFGGSLTTVAAAGSAFGASLGRGLNSLDTAGPVVAGAATAGAVTALVDIWKQTVERRAKRRENKFSIFWDLGVKSPSQLRRRKSLSKFKALKSSTPVLIKEAQDCHWMCESAPNLRLVFQARSS